VGDDDTTNDSGGELRDLWRQFTRPIVDQVDTKLRSEIDKRVDDRVNEILADRLAVFERALADLDRAVKELKAKSKRTS
jgi:hypothetical protein